MQKSITRPEIANERKSFVRKVLYVAMPTVGVAVYFIIDALYKAYAIGVLNQ